MVNFALLGRLCFLSFKHRELVWRQGTEAAVRAEVIAIVAPCFDGPAGLGSDRIGSQVVGLPTGSTGWGIFRKIPPVDLWALGLS